jgi:hypothetical protein
MTEGYVMKRFVVLIILAIVPAVSQIDRQPPPQPDGKLPNGKSQQEAILKADYEKSIKDAAQLIELAESLKIDLEKNDAHVLSVSSLKKTEEIEKIAKRIRSRLKRF